MNDSDGRGLLRTIKVPFDIKAIMLGGLGYLIFVVGGWILNAAFTGIRDGQNVIARFIHQGLQLCGLESGPSSIPLIGGEVRTVITQLFGAPSRGLDTLEMIVVGVWFLLILAVFGGAICRVIALRIARDESTSVMGALNFSLTNVTSYLAVPLFLGGAIFFFWCCNLLAGLVGSIPVAGQILFIVLYPLAILSSLIIVLIAVGGLLGLFMMVAAISTEKNGTLDAISRAFSYIYTRPLQFFFYYFLIFLLASIIVLIGARVFPGILLSSIDTGTYPGSAFETGFRSGAAQALYNLPDLRGLGFVGGLGASVTWFITTVLMIGILGYVVSYILGGSTAIYFALRRDVDGTDDSEVYVEGAEDEDDFGLPPVTPPAVTPPAATPPVEEKKEEPAPEAGETASEKGESEGENKE